MALKAIDDEQKAFDKAHNDKMKKLREEREENSFEKDLTERQDNVAELTQKRDSYAMDDSRAGKARAKEIEEELKAAQEDLNEFLQEREYSQREKALDEQATQKQEAFDKEREELTKHYDNLLNDEAKFEELRQQVIIGNIQGLSTELMKFANLAKQNMESIGESITETFVNSITEVREKLGEFSDGFQQRAVVRNPTKLTHGEAGGKQEYRRDMKPGEEFEITGYSEMNGGMYRLGKASSNLWVSASDVDLKFLKQFDTGGFTGNGSGLAMLHEKEIVLNKDDTKNFLQGIKLLRPIANLLKNPVLPKFNQSVSTASSPAPISITIENLSVAGGKQGFNELMKEFDNRFSGKGMFTRI
ncbi:hypothetical protein D3C84_393830 [compost metagenome]